MNAATTASCLLVAGV
ncbi:hypothetical protein OYC64_022137, partial [Pagothenia borchgrevinki]